VFGHVVLIECQKDAILCTDSISTAKRIMLFQATLSKTVLWCYFNTLLRRNIESNLTLSNHIKSISTLTSSKNVCTLCKSELLSEKRYFVFLMHIKERENWHIFDLFENLVLSPSNQLHTHSQEVVSSQAQQLHCSCSYCSPWSVRLILNTQITKALTPT
jgi:hypothetical protein